MGTADASINLTPTNGSAAYAYLWNTSDTANVLTELAAGIYVVTITDTNGCNTNFPITVAASTEVCDTVHPVIYLPNIFSPNGDNINDVLYVRGQGITSMSLIIYDRWGEKVFESTTPENGWDGRFRGQFLESAVFAYSLKAEFSDGNKVKKKGTITLVR
jgi:gliding motility-associated-like protein